MGLIKPTEKNICWFDQSLKKNNLWVWPNPQIKIFYLWVWPNTQKNGRKFETKNLWNIPFNFLWYIYLCTISGQTNLKYTIKKMWVWANPLFLKPKKSQNQDWYKLKKKNGAQKVPKSPQIFLNYSTLIRSIKTRNYKWKWIPIHN